MKLKRIFLTFAMVGLALGSLYAGTFKWSESKIVSFTSQTSFTNMTANGFILGGAECNYYSAASGTICFYAVRQIARSADYTYPTAITNVLYCHAFSAVRTLFFDQESFDLSVIRKGDSFFVNDDSGVRNTLTLNLFSSRP